MTDAATRTLTDEQVQQVAFAHEQARRTGEPIRRVTLDHPGMTVDDAYACQEAWIRLQVADGARIRGHKIGLTSRAMQQAMGIDEPDYGTLLDYMFFDNGATIDVAPFLDLRLEVEIAFRLSETIRDGATVTRDDVRRATSSVVAAVELIDARSYRVDPVDRVSRTVRDTIADNAANAGIVLGDVEVGPDERDLRWLGAICRRNGIVEETGLAAGVLDDPVAGVVWLAQRYAHHGMVLEEGQVVLAGSFTRPLECRAGDEFDIDFADLGTITVAFS